MNDEYKPEVNIEVVDDSMSPEIGELAGALAKAQAEITGAVKDSQNPFFKSSYADLAAVMDACKPLSSHGLSYIQLIGSSGPEKTVTTILAHESGQWMRSTCGVIPAKQDAQAAGSVYTYLRRYALSAIAGIAQVDDDGEASLQRGDMTGLSLDTNKLQDVVNEIVNIIDDPEATMEGSANALSAIFHPLHNDERMWVQGKLRDKKTKNPDTGREVSYMYFVKKIGEHKSDA